jgi:predicted nucleic acid-binding protein
VLLIAARRRRITRADATRFGELLGELPLTVASSPEIRDLDALMAMGREHGLSACDAAYLHLAMRERLPLATRDRALRTAARGAGVPLLAAR